MKESFGENRESKNKTMNCGHTDKLIPELEKEGWEYLFSFNRNSTEQWNMACEKVDESKQVGDWEVILVNGQDNMEKQSGVQYLYRRETEQRKKLKKDFGY